MSGPHDENEAASKPGGGAETTYLAPTERFVQDAGLHPLSARYDLIRELGRGGMGAVYLARDRETNDTVALKILKDGIAADAAAVENFKAELVLARKITHPNVCRVYELVRFDRLVAISMEYIDGESLRSLLRGVTGFSVLQGLRIAREIGAALAAAHAQGVVHRDLKPENIVLARTGTVKVLDFGIAGSIEPGTDTGGAISGTPAYMSPEQLAGQHADQRSDIYSFGLILYELFTGRPAANTEPGGVLGVRRSREPPPSPSDINPYLPGFLSAAIMRCLETAPQKRFQSAGELLEALERKAPTPVAFEPSPRHLVTAVRRDGWLAVGALAGLALFIALAPRAIPDARFKIRASQRMLADQAVSELAARGFDGATIQSIRVVGSYSVFSYLARIGQLTEAVTCLNTDCQPYYLDINLSFVRAPNSFNWVSLYLNGTWRSINLYSAPVTIRGANPTPDESRAIAEKDFLSLLKTDVAGWKLDRSNPVTGGDRRGYGFSWSKVTDSGLTRTANATVYDRSTSLSTTIQIPPEPRPREAIFRDGFAGEADAIYDRNVVIVGLGIVFLFIFVAKRVYLKVEVQELGVLAATALVTGLASGLRNTHATGYSASTHLALVLLNYGGPALFLMLVVVPTAATIAQRRWSYASRSFHSLVRLKTEPTVALAVWRGCACGLILVGSYLAVRTVGAAYGLTWLGLRSHSGVLNSPVPALNILATAVLVSAGIGFVLFFVVALLRRFTSNIAMLTFGGALMWLPMLSNITFTPIRMAPFSVAVTFAFAAALCLELLTFDLLTVLVSILTISLFTDGYALLGMFEQLGNGQFWMLFILWAAAALWGAFCGFRPLWSRAGRRLAEAFE